MWIRDKDGNLWNGDQVQHILLTPSRVAGQPFQIDCWISDALPITIYTAANREDADAAMEYLNESVRFNLFADLLHFDPMQFRKMRQMKLEKPREENG